MTKKKSKESKGSTIHIRLGSDEAITGKRDLLSSEINLLKISQSITNHKKFRIEELGKKELIRKKMGEAKKNLSHLQNLLPSPKIPKILQKEVSPLEMEKEEIEMDISRERRKSPSDVEDQLREIQAKLERLESY